jgi:hypothetical protein
MDYLWTVNGKAVFGLSHKECAKLIRYREYKSCGGASRPMESRLFCMDYYWIKLGYRVCVRREGGAASHNNIAFVIRLYP